MGQHLDTHIHTLTPSPSSFKCLHKIFFQSFLNSCLSSLLERGNGKQEPWPRLSEAVADQPQWAFCPGDARKQEPGMASSGVRVTGLSYPGERGWKTWLLETSSKFVFYICVSMINVVKGQSSCNSLGCRADWGPQMLLLWLSHSPNQFSAGKTFSYPWKAISVSSLGCQLFSAHSDFLCNKCSSPRL